MARWIYRLNKQRTTAENSRWEQSARLLSGKVPFSHFEEVDNHRMAPGSHCGSCSDPESGKTGLPYFPKENEPPLHHRLGL